MEELQQDLELLKASLKNAPKQTNNQYLVREMERQIREVVYEVEDTIDSCMTKAAEAKSRGSLRRSLNMLSPVGFSLGKQIKLLRQDSVRPMLDKVISDFSNIKIAQLPSQDHHRIMSEFIRVDQVVGLEDEERTITNYLWEESKEVEVISIIGMPGLGKTTLAFKIFQKPEVAFVFPIRIWIQVSQGFDRRAVFLSILKHFTRQDMQLQSDEELVNKIRECLENTKFLLVFDDVWSVEDWNIFKGVLPQTNGRGKVLITSRDSRVGRYASAGGKCHMLRLLTLQESWELLRIEVFSRQGHDNTVPELEDVGKRIVMQCDGLPLAIVMVGGVLKDLLLNLPSMPMVRKRWEEVCGNMQSSLRSRMNNESLSGIVGMSFEELEDEHMRECFLYMGVFPKGYPIPAPTLIRMWIAEGLVPPKEGRRLEETALEYLEHLISRNLVVASTRNWMGEVKMCCVHGLILAFCNLKAREQNLFQEIRMSESGEVEPPISEMHKFRRLSLDSSHLNAFLRQKPVGPRVRSLLTFSTSTHSDSLQPECSSLIPEGFNLLRVLESKPIKFHSFPGIPELIHLRYLTFCIDDLRVIPEAVSQLWNLQTLVVDSNAPSITMKANIWEMVRLRHLKTNVTIDLDANLKPQSGTTHQNLQTITTLSPESCTSLLSATARKLRTLGVRGKLTSFFQTMSLGELHHLENLKLKNDSDESNRPQGLPQPNCFPKYLNRLTLSNTFLHWEHISTLAKIDTLEALKLKNNAFTGISWIADGEGFKSLQFLLIEYADLVRWDSSPGYLPVLRFLVIKRCEKLIEIPMGLAKCLEQLEMHYVPKSAVECAKRIKEVKLQEQSPQKYLRWGSDFKLIIGPECV